MLMQSFEDWLIGAASVAAVAVTVGAHVLAQPIAGTAIAAERVQPAYSITVTGKRLPAICKTEAGLTAEVCQHRGETRVEVRSY